MSKWWSSDVNSAPSADRRDADSASFASEGVPLTRRNLVEAEFAFFVDSQSQDSRALTPRLMLLSWMFSQCP